MSKSNMNIFPVAETNNAAKSEAKRLTHMPGHHFFGFHDVCAWNPEGNKIAALRVNRIDRPPTGMDIAEAGYIDAHTNQFTALLETTAYNFPQGARQLWTPEGGYWVNIRVDHQWGAVRVTEDGVRKQTIGQALYAISKDGTRGWGLNFARLNRLLAYGYVGIADRTANEPAPRDDGLWSVDLLSGDEKLLLSLHDIATAAGGKIGNGHHYLTHIVPSPSNHRLMFLHRYWLTDGGLHHRLMSVCPDGSDLRLHAEGFLSHFDWQDDQRIVIWGRANSSVDRLRRNPFLQIQVLRPIMNLAKKVVKEISKNRVDFRMSFLQINIETGEQNILWPDILSEDGHPMFCPAQREWMIVDAYPDDNGVRPLMLLNVITGVCNHLGHYSMLQAKPNTNSLKLSLEHVDPYLVDKVGQENFAFWRSGLHCDLHPRWKADGSAVCFDSIHEGTRQMYCIDTSRILNP